MRSVSQAELQAPTLATTRRMLKGALLLSVLVGMALFIYLPLARH
jgi:hypothetical protein